jgi:RNA recognition motif-containing protein
MTRTLHVTNLSPTTSPRDLRDLFSRAGHVAAITVVRDGITGRDRRVAYVHMQSDDGATAAVARFHQHRLLGRTLNVSAGPPDAGASGTSHAPLEAMLPPTRTERAGDGTLDDSTAMADDDDAGADRNAS